MITQGKHTYIGLPTYEYFAPIVTIGKYTSIAEEVLWCGSMNHPTVKYREAVANFNFNAQWRQDYFDKGFSRGPIFVGNDVWIGKGAVIMDGVSIGDGATVGLHAVVTRDVPPYAVVAGNPAQIKHYRFDREKVKLLLAIKWWDWPEEVIVERMKDFLNIKDFLDKWEVP